MNAEVKQKWVAALKSGRYSQTTGALKQGGAYCCLGVLCDIYGKENNQDWDEAGSFLGQFEHLPGDVCKWAGLTFSEIALRNPIVKTTLPSAKQEYDYTLVQLNDCHSYNFDTIAELIEAQL